MADKASLGQAYVQIIPSAEGIQGKISNIFNEVGDSAGQGLGSKIANIVKTAIVGAGIGKLIQSSIAEGANLEQSIGGIETLYKESADVMKRYANEAYKTAGLSANDYMQTATSYAAALVSSLGGDTAKAAEVANQAIIDMSDNANKMGTDMQSIQNAYQGFAKQNYTMLDNLKLGYGGTKTEMQRLLKDAQKLTGIEYNIDNLSDVYEAIHVIQNELDITGTTALEATDTISGSMGMVKASISNVLASLTLGTGVQQAVNDLVNSAVYALANLGKAVINIVASIPTAIISALQSAGQVLVENWDTIVATIKTAMTESIPQFLESTMTILSEMIQSIVDNLPNFIETLGSLLEDVINFIGENLPSFLQKGVEMIQSMIAGIKESLPNILVSISKVMINLLKTILSNLPQLLESGYKLMGSLVSGVIKSIPAVISGVLQVIKEIWEQFTSINWWELGKNIIIGIKNGIVNFAGTLYNAVKDTISNVWNSVTGFFGIHSPSRKMAWVGEMIDRGLALGIDENTNVVDKAIENLNDSADLTVQGKILESIVDDNTNTRVSSKNSTVTTNESDSFANLIKDGKLVLMLDSGEIVGALSEKIDGALGQLQLRRARG